MNDFNANYLVAATYEETPSWCYPRLLRCCSCRAELASERPDEQMHLYYTSKSSRLNLKLEVCYISGVSNVSGIKKVLKISRRTRVRVRGSFISVCWYAEIFFPPYFIIIIRFCSCFSWLWVTLNFQNISYWFAILPAGTLQLLMSSFPSILICFFSFVLFCFCFFSLKTNGNLPVYICRLMWVWWLSFVCLFIKGLHRSE